MRRSPVSMLSATHTADHLALDLNETPSLNTNSRI